MVLITSRVTRMGADYGIAESPIYKMSIVFRGQAEVVRPNPDGMRVD